MLNSVTQFETYKKSAEFKEEAQVFVFKCEKIVQAKSFSSFLEKGKCVSNLYSRRIVSERLIQVCFTQYTTFDEKQKLATVNHYTL